MQLGAILRPTRGTSKGNVGDSMLANCANSFSQSRLTYVYYLEAKPPTHRVFVLEHGIHDDQSVAFNPPGWNMELEIPHVVSF